MMINFTVIIPARMNSKRLSNKPLQLINKMPMIFHTFCRVKKSDAKRIIIAADNPDIIQTCKNFNAEVILTNTDHNSGTDRLNEACQILNLPDDEIIVNVQGDEPLINPKLINQIAQALYESKTDMATLCESITNKEDIKNRNIVKVVCNKNDLALYFSRSPIPFDRDNAGNVEYFRHIGIYAYKRDFLKKFSQLPQCNIEKIEKLEQLRAIYNGYQIITPKACVKSQQGVDTIEDLIRVKTILESQQNNIYNNLV